MNVKLIAVCVAVGSAIAAFGYGLGKSSTGVPNRISAEGSSNDGPAHSGFMSNHIAQASASSSTFADAQAALDRMKARSEAALGSEKILANNGAVNMLNALMRGEHGKVMANMTNTCAQTYAMNGPLMSLNFVMGHSITSQDVKPVRGHITDCSGDRAVFHFILQRGWQSEPNGWVDFDDCTLHLIKENGQWKVDSCDSREILR